MYKMHFIQRRVYLTCTERQPLWPFHLSYSQRIEALLDAFSEASPALVVIAALRLATAKHLHLASLHCSSQTSKPVGLQMPVLA